MQTGRKNVEKGEIARYEQFLLFPQCFQKACFPGASKGVIVWEWVSPLPPPFFRAQLMYEPSPFKTLLKHFRDVIKRLIA